MNRILIGSLLVGTMLVAGSYGSPPASAGLAATVVVPPAAAVPVNAAGQPPAPAAEPPPDIELSSVNGISLYDDAPAVLAIAGAPDAVSKDSVVKGLMIMQYPGMQIGIEDGMASFVSVPAAAKSIVLDGTQVPVNLAALKKVLGNPDFTAEDGIVFRRGERLLKIFFEPGTEQIRSIDYYSISNV